MKPVIIIWDLCPERIHTLRTNAEIALKNIGKDATIQINCEEPLISRNGLLGKLPAIQLDGTREIWKCNSGENISVEEFSGLFAMLLETEKSETA